MTFFAFLGALSLTILVFELMTVLQEASGTFGNSRLINVRSSGTNKMRSTWEALLVAVLPGRFDPNQAKTLQM